MKCPTPPKEDLEKQEKLSIMHGWSLIVSLLSILHFALSICLFASSAYCIIRDVTHWDRQGFVQEPNGKYVLYGQIDVIIQSIQIL